MVFTFLSYHKEQCDANLLSGVRHTGRKTIHHVVRLTGTARFLSPANPKVSSKQGQPAPNAGNTLQRKHDDGNPTQTNIFGLGFAAFTASHKHQFHTAARKAAILQMWSPPQNPPKGFIKLCQQTEARLIRSQLCKGNELTDNNRFYLSCTCFWAKNQISAVKIMHHTSKLNIKLSSWTITSFHIITSSS